MRVFLFSLILLALTVLPVAAVANSITVSVSIPPQKYFVEKIGGNAVSVTVMTAKGQDPHSYEPTAAQMEGITKTDIYFTIGVPFETQWISKFTSLNPNMRVVSLVSAVDRIQGKPDLALRNTLPGKGKHTPKKNDHKGHAHAGHHHHGLETDDPHIWLSPVDMMRTVPTMVEALSQKCPDQAEVFATRAEALLREMENLDAQIRELLAPVKARAFLTFHQSWAHYARNYALREASVELEGRDPGPKSMALLIDFAKTNNIRVIVEDSMTSSSSAKAIANHLKAETIHSRPLDEDWPGALLEFSKTLAKALGAQ